MDTSLPSKVGGIDFTATLRAAWIGDETQISRQQGYALSMEYLWRKAESVTTQWYVLHHEAAMAAVNAVIDPVVELKSAPVSVTGHVTLSASGQAISATRDYLALDRDERVRSARVGAQLYELRRALKSPGLAHLWWASNNPEHLAVIDTDAFKNLVRVIAESSEQELSPQTSIEQVLLKFTAELTSTQDRQLLLNVFKHVLAKFDKHDLEGYSGGSVEM